MPFSVTKRIFKSLMSLESRIVYADIEDKQGDARTGVKKEVGASSRNLQFQE